MMNARSDFLDVKNVLLVVRPERDTDWATNFVIQLYQREPVRIHLLSVQTPFNGHVRMFFDDATIHAFHLEDGESEILPVKQALEGAGVPHETHVQVGFSASAIADFARTHDCVQIVIGPPVRRELSQLLLGSLTEQVSHLMQNAGRACEVV